MTRLSMGEIARFKKWFESLGKSDQFFFIRNFYPKVSKEDSLSRRFLDLIFRPTTQDEVVRRIKSAYYKEHPVSGKNESDVDELLGVTADQNLLQYIKLSGLTHTEVIEAINIFRKTKIEQEESTDQMELPLSK